MGDNPARWTNPNFGTFSLRHEEKTHRFEGGVVIVADELDEVLSKTKAPSGTIPSIRGLEKAD